LGGSRPCGVVDTAGARTGCNEDGGIQTAANELGSSNRIVPGGRKSTESSRRLLYIPAKHKIEKLVDCKKTKKQKRVEIELTLIRLVSSKREGGAVTSLRVIYTIFYKTTPLFLGAESNWGVSVYVYTCCVCT
jgi:hypothetical protein